MSKLISADDKVKAWAVPKLASTPGSTVTPASNALSAREMQAVEERLGKLKETARKQGYEQGLQEGRAAAKVQLERQAKALQSLLDAMATPLAALDAQVEHELVNLTVAIAKQIVRRELKTDPGQVIAVVRETLSIIPSSVQHVRVFLHPEDAELVRKIIPSNAGERTWDIVDDPILTRGSCKVETETTQIDASFESRIAAIAAEILGSERSDVGTE